MLGLTYKLALYKGSFKLALMAFDNMSTDGSGFDSFSGTDVGFAFVSPTLVGTDLFRAFDYSPLIVDTCVRNVGAYDCVICPNVYFADASFEASAFY